MNWRVWREPEQPGGAPRWLFAAVLLAGFLLLAAYLLGMDVLVQVILWPLLAALFVIGAYNRRGDKTASKLSSITITRDHVIDQKRARWDRIPTSGQTFLSVAEARALVDAADQILVRYSDGKLWIVRKSRTGQFLEVAHESQLGNDGRGQRGFGFSGYEREGRVLVLIEQIVG